MDSNIDILRQLITEGEKFTFSNFCYPNESSREYGGDDTPEWLAWKTRTRNLVNNINSDTSPAVRLVKEAAGVLTRGNYKEQFERAKKTFLKALQMTLEAVTDDSFGELRSTTSKAASAALSNKVFIVHGHDHGLKTDVERFVHQIGLEPVVLHRQPDKGLTIIEKFEEHSDVGYAFILLTPDEVAYTIDQEPIGDEARVKERRARPNVIFEFGYFVGKLGRDRVCCIYKEGVELPSDLTGLIYKKVSDTIETQAFSIIRELKAAGFNIQL